MVHDWFFVEYGGFDVLIGNDIYRSLDMVAAHFNKLYVLRRELRINFELSSFNHGFVTRMCTLNSIVLQFIYISVPV